MIHHLDGILSQKGETPTGTNYLVVDVHGIGFQVMTSVRSFAQTSPVQEAIRLHTSLIVREDAMQLVGFITREERELFELLSSASGVGLKGALSLMSSLAVSDLAGAITSGDHKLLTAAKGIGPKLAQKICLELKDKVNNWRDAQPFDALTSGRGNPTEISPAFEEAETILINLGYTLDEIRAALTNISQNDAAAATASAEVLLQNALKWLATKPVS